MTRAKDISKILTDADISGTLDVTGATTITTADNTVQLTLKSTDADANEGPVLDLVRDSASPADVDLLGTLRFRGDNDAGEVINYAKILARAEDVTDGTEDGRISINTIVAGTERSRLKIDNTEVVLNENSIDSDFRVETNANTHGLFVDGGSDLVSIGQSDLRAKLSIGKAKSGTGVESVNLLSLEPTGTFAIGDTANITFHRGSTTTARISGYYGDDDASYGELVFSTRRYTTDALNEGFRLDNRGNVLVGKTANDISTVGHRLGGGGSYASHSRANEPALYVNRNSSNGLVLGLQKDGSDIGGIGVNGRLTVSGTNGSTGSGIYFNINGWLPTNKDAGLVDNTISLGTATYRMAILYSGTGSINTSDRNEKQDIEELTDVEKRVAVVAKGLLRKYRFKDAVAEKGDDARTHFGIIAQDLQDAFTAESLDASRYAMFCSDTWWEKEISVDAVEAVEEVKDEEGNVTTEAVEAKDAYTYLDDKQEATEGYTERTRLGVRYSELLAFIIAAI